MQGRKGSVTGGSAESFERFYKKRRDARQVFIQRERTTGARVVVKRYSRATEAAPEYEVMKAYRDHPNLVRLLDFVVIEEQGHLVMEWLDGRTINEMVKQSGAVERARVITIALQVLKGLTALHGLGYVHGDLHGDNVMVLNHPMKTKSKGHKTAEARRPHGDGGPRETSSMTDPQAARVPRVKIIDFQHAVKKDKSGKARAIRTLPDPPDQLAPESRTGLIDDTYDIYGVGYLCAVMLSGKAPDRAAIVGVTFKDDALWKVVQRAMHEDPKQRYRSASEMARVLGKLS